MTLQEMKGPVPLLPDAKAELAEIQLHQDEADSAKFDRKAKNQEKLAGILVKCRSTGKLKAEGLHELMKMVGHVTFWSRQKTLQVKVIGQNRKITSNGTVVDIGSRYVQFQNQLLDVIEKDVLDGMLNSKEFGRLFVWLEDAAQVVKNINAATDKAEGLHHKLLPKEIAGELPDHSVPAGMSPTPYSAEDGG